MTYATPKLTAIAITTLAFAIETSAAWPQESPPNLRAAQQINAANEMVRRGEFESAIEQYQQVPSNSTNQDKLNYNLAVANYRNGNVEAAQDLFTQTAQATDDRIAADSRYNLGNCRYTRAIQLAQQDKSAAIDQLRQSITDYRSSLHLRPENADARANIELAAKLIQQLEEEQQQQQQPQPNDQQQGQKQDQSTQNQAPQDQPPQGEQQPSEQQPSEQQPSEQQPSEQQQESQSPQATQQGSGAPEKAEQNSTPQDQPGQESDSSSQSQGEPQQPADQQDASPSSQQKAQTAQSKRQNQPQSSINNSEQQASQSAGKEGAEEDDKEPHDEQTLPTGQLTAAGQQDSGQEPNGTATIADPNDNQELMTKEEALKMLQAVRDRDMLRRLQQRQQERSRRIQVERDW